MSAHLSLPEELTIYTVGEHAPLWRDALLAADAEPPAGPYVIDCSAVQEIDGAGVQLVVSLAHALKARHWPCQLQSPTPALADAFDRLGAHPLLTELSTTAEEAAA
ncbi:MAG: hypothetical protein RI907_1081 [Pseudomonadota bacterium]|jgi:anti-anti-sigma regulatory factor